MQVTALMRWGLLINPSNRAQIPVPGSLSGQQGPGAEGGSIGSSCVSQDPACPYAPREGPFQEGSEMKAGTASQTGTPGEAGSFLVCLVLQAMVFAILPMSACLPMNALL